MGSGRGSRVEGFRRAFRTLLFMVTMVASLLVSSLPLLVSVVDVIAPCVLLSTFTCCSSCFKLHHDWASYSFRASLLDVPFLSVTRSLVIFCVYSICGVPNWTYGLYVSAAGICGCLSAVLLLVKAWMFSNYDSGVLQGWSPLHVKHLRTVWGVCLLFSSSITLALAHIMVAYKVKCQAQRKMHVYRLDPEAMSGLNSYLQIRGNEKHRRLLIEDGWDGSSTQKESTHKFMVTVGKT